MLPDATGGVDWYFNGLLGFEWGYGGSGPAQLALAMSVELVGPVRALKVYRRVLEQVVALVETDKWSILGGAVMEAMGENEELLDEAAGADTSG